MLTITGMFDENSEYGESESYRIISDEGEIIPSSSGSSYFNDYTRSWYNDYSLLAISEKANLNNYYAASLDLSTSVEVAWPPMELKDSDSYSIDKLNCTLPVIEFQCSGAYGGRQNISVDGISEYTNGLILLVKFVTNSIMYFDSSDFKLGINDLELKPIVPFYKVKSNPGLNEIKFVDGPNNKMVNSELYSPLVYYNDCWIFMNSVLKPTSNIV